MWRCVLRSFIQRYWLIPFSKLDYSQLRRQRGGIKRKTGREIVTKNYCVLSDRHGQGQGQGREKQAENMDDCRNVCDRWSVLPVASSAHRCWVSAEKQKEEVFSPRSKM